MIILPTRQTLRKEGTQSHGPTAKEGDATAAGLPKWEGQGRFIGLAVLLIGIVSIVTACFQFPKPPPKRAFSELISFAVGDGPNSIATGDFNEDGHLDLAAANYQSNDISILLGNGRGSFSSAINFPADNTPISIGVGHFNTLKDSHPDLVVVNSLNNRVSVLFGDGQGSFSRPTSFPVPGPSPPPVNLYAVAVGDLNRDGFQDLVTANGVWPDGWFEDTISILLGDGGGGFATLNPIPVGYGALFVTIGKFNSDDYPDLAVVNSGQIAVLFSKGRGDFILFNHFYVTEDQHLGGPWTLAVGDFNKDGHDDLVTTLPDADAVAILLGDGMGNFGQAGIVAVGDAPHQVAIADFNRDSHQDLVVTNYLDNTVSVLWGDGSGGFNIADFPAGDTPQGVTIGDFDEDGDLDIAVTNRTSGTVSVLLNQLL